MRIELNIESVKRKNKYVKIDKRIERASEIYEIKGDMEIFEERFIRHSVQME